MPPSWTPLCRTMQVYCEPFFVALDRWIKCKEEGVLYNRIQAVETLGDIFQTFSQNPATHKFEIVCQNETISLLPEVFPTAGRDYKPDGDQIAYEVMMKKIPKQLFQRGGVFFQDNLLKGIAGYSEEKLKASNLETRATIISAVDKLLRIAEGAGDVHFYCSREMNGKYETVEYPIAALSSKGLAFYQYLVEVRKKGFDFREEGAAEKTEASSANNQNKSRSAGQKKKRGNEDKEEAEWEADPDGILWTRKHTSIGQQVAAHFPPLEPQQDLVPKHDFPDAPTTNFGATVGKIFRGTVVKYAKPSAPGMTDQLYHIRWEDGDEQDFDELDMEKGMDLFDQLDGWTTRHGSVGTRVASYFELPVMSKGKGKNAVQMVQSLFFGTVTKYGMPLTSDEQPLYHVVYDDGDEQDMNDAELQLSIELYKSKQSEDTVGGSSKKAKKDKKGNSSSSSAQPAPVSDTKGRGGRGSSSVSQVAASSTAVVAADPPKKGRGNKNKNPVAPEVVAPAVVVEVSVPAATAPELVVDLDAQSHSNSTSATKRGRGRQPRSALSADPVASIPAVDTTAAEVATGDMASGDLVSAASSVSKSRRGRPPRSSSLVAKSSAEPELPVIVVEEASTTRGKRGRSARSISPPKSTITTTTTTSAILDATTTVAPVEATVEMPVDEAVEAVVEAAVEAAVEYDATSLSTATKKRRGRKPRTPSVPESESVLLEPIVVSADPVKEPSPVKDPVISDAAPSAVGRGRGRPGRSSSPPHEPAVTKAASPVTEAVSTHASPHRRGRGSRAAEIEPMPVDSKNTAIVHPKHAPDAIKPSPAPAAATAVTAASVAAITAASVAKSASKRALLNDSPSIDDALPMKRGRHSSIKATEAAAYEKESEKERETAKEKSKVKEKVKEKEMEKETEQEKVKEKTPKKKEMTVTTSAKKGKRGKDDQMLETVATAEVLEDNEEDDPEGNAVVWIMHHNCVGKRVAQHFQVPGKKGQAPTFEIYGGTVACYAPPTSVKAKDQLYHIVWDDEDEADFDETELRRGLLLLDQLMPTKLQLLSDKARELVRQRQKKMVVDYSEPTPRASAPQAASIFAADGTTISSSSSGSASKTKDAGHHHTAQPSAASATAPAASPSTSVAPTAPSSTAATDTATAASQERKVTEGAIQMVEAYSSTPEESPVIRPGTETDGSSNDLEKMDVVTEKTNGAIPPPPLPPRHLLAAVHAAPAQAQAQLDNNPMLQGAVTNTAAPSSTEVESTRSSGSSNCDAPRIPAVDTRYIPPAINYDDDTCRRYGLDSTRHSERSYFSGAGYHSSSGSSSANSHQEYSNTHNYDNNNNNNNNGNVFAATAAAAVGGFAGFVDNSQSDFYGDGTRFHSNSVPSMDEINVEFDPLSTSNDGFDDEAVYMYLGGEDGFPSETE